jgi:hypothetical protein
MITSDVGEPRREVSPAEVHENADRLYQNIIVQTTSDSSMFKLRAQPKAVGTMLKRTSPSKGAGSPQDSVKQVQTFPPVRTSHNHFR